ncbi:hypothetical protein J4232_03585 [Candidatus Woesearchaeota archaeon]|nr:hypothetical protein [Candidatus Woesearchaeota archaeon]
MEQSNNGSNQFVDELIQRLLQDGGFLQDKSENNHQMLLVPSLASIKPINCYQRFDKLFKRVVGNEYNHMLYPDFFKNIE